jgi:hypothetical protein
VGRVDLWHGYRLASSHLSGKRHLHPVHNKRRGAAYRRRRRRHSRSPPRRSVRTVNSRSNEQAETLVFFTLYPNNIPPSEGVPNPNLMRRYNMSDMKSLYKKCVNDESTWPHYPTNARIPGTRYTTMAERLCGGFAMDGRNNGE